MYKDTHGNDQDQIWESENLGMEVYTGLDYSGNALFLKLSSGNMLLYYSLYMYIFFKYLIFFKKGNCSILRHPVTWG